MRFVFWTLVLILALLILSGCGMKTGDGVFNGRLVDVGYGGLLFDTCEMDFQLGEQSSTVSKCSSPSKEFCERMKPYVGKVIEVKYDSIFPWIRYESGSICYGEVK